MIRLLVKGTATEAVEAAQARHIALADLVEWEGPAGPVTRASAGIRDLLRICAWLQERAVEAPDGRGLAPGTLLHFTCGRERG